ncbi:hypothetical protein [Microbacterium oxydans]|uniref:hypothetical protein n=1 Tax=Microbacterium oxydans TaxID=82380 RepID=UPI0022B1AFBD|nr:hypothetical protein [Microbacterium oxydans]MCZ4302491.1 hypothetical protein [Microbacterium oxydans]
MRSGGAGPAPTCTLRAGRARATVAPGHGCLIVDLDPGTGNVLWVDGRSPRMLESSALLGEESAREFDEDVLLGGWFPMFPAAGLPTAGTQQHGWAPRVAWTAVERTATRLVCTATGAFLNGGVAEVTRAIRLEPDALIVSSTVRNAGDGMRFFTWGEHPCFSRDVFARGRAGFAGDEVAVPGDANGTAGHLCFSGTTASVTGPGVSLTLTDQAGTLPHWLLWYNYAADELRRADTLAWEPSTAAGLGIGDALAEGAIQWLRPDQYFRTAIRCEWTLSTIFATPVR